MTNLYGGCQPLLMLLLDTVCLKTILTITSILQSVKRSMYWASSQHRCPANTTGLTDKEDMVSFPEESTTMNICLPIPPKNNSRFCNTILNLIMKSNDLYFSFWFPLSIIASLLSHSSDWLPINHFCGFLGPSMLCQNGKGRDHNWLLLMTNL